MYQRGMMAKKRGSARGSELPEEVPSDVPLANTSSFDSHKIVIITAIAVGIITLSFILFYSPTREALFGKAVAGGDASLCVIDRAPTTQQGQQSAHGYLEGDARCVHRQVTRNGESGYENFCEFNRNGGGGGKIYLPSAADDASRNAAHLNLPGEKTILLSVEADYLSDQDTNTQGTQGSFRTLVYAGKKDGNILEGDDRLFWLGITPEGKLAYIGKSNRLIQTKKSLPFSDEGRCMDRRTGEVVPGKTREECTRDGISAGRCAIRSEGSMSPSGLFPFCPGRGYNVENGVCFITDITLWEGCLVWNSCKFDAADPSRGGQNVLDSSGHFISEVGACNAAEGVYWKGYWASDLEWQGPSAASRKANVAVVIKPNEEGVRMYVDGVLQEIQAVEDRLLIQPTGLLEPAVSSFSSLVDQGGATLNPNQVVLHLGQAYDALPHTGALSHLQIYDFALSRQQINSLHPAPSIPVTHVLFEPEFLRRNVTGITGGEYKLRVLNKGEGPLTQCRLVNSLTGVEGQWFVVLRDFTFDEARYVSLGNPPPAPSNPDDIVIQDFQCSAMTNVLQDASVDKVVEIECQVQSGRSAIAYVPIAC